MTAFEEMFLHTRDRVNYLDDLNAMPKLPSLVTNSGMAFFPAAADMYLEGKYFQSSNHDESELPIIRMANRACAIHDNEPEIAAAFVSKINPFRGRNSFQKIGTVGKKRPKGLPQISPLGQIEEIQFEYELQARAMVYDLIAMLSTGEPIVRLWEMASGGDFNALMDLVRIDKSVVTTATGVEMMRNRQFEANWEFFAKLGKAIAKPPMPNKPYPAKAVILTARFWHEEFHAWSRNDLVGFLVENDVLADLHGSHVSFLRTIRKLYLTKDGPGRPKKGT